MFDFVVVGDGPAGFITAHYWIAKGFKVCLLAGGIPQDSINIPNADFQECLASEHNDYFYPGDVDVGAGSGHAQITKARQHMLYKVREYLPLESINFQPFQTLAAGGLSAGWGAACFTFEEEDRKRAGIWASQEDYESVAQIIGVSGPDRSKFCNIQNKQPAAHIDHNGRSLLNKKRKSSFELEQSSLALLTQDLGDRKSTQYQDMDFYHNPGNSVFRANVGLKELESHANFHYVPYVFATKFVECEKRVEVSYTNLQDHTVLRVVGKKLIVCGGAINSYRFVAHSLGVYEQKNPILTNSYIYIPTLNWDNIGRPRDEKCHSLAQVFGEHQTHGDDKLTLQFYSYRSLLLSRLIIGTPMPFRAARLFWRALVESLTIVGVHFPDNGLSPRHIQIQASEGIPKLEVDFPFPQTKGTKTVLSKLIRLGLIPMGILKTPMGGSIHYAGTLPFSAPGDWPVGLDSATSRVHNTHNVYVFDSSGWKYLPSRGLTLTIMAHAHQCSENLYKELVV